MTAVLGAAVDANQPLVEVADVAALDVVFNVSPAQAAQINGADSVHVTAGEGEGGEAVGQGTVTAVGAAVDSSSRAVVVRARIGRPARPLRIGESVFGRMVTAVHAGAVTVPVAALVPSGDGFQVVVVDSGRIPHVAAVTVRGASEISITFAPRTDMTYALQLVRARVNQVSGALPPDVSIEVEQLTPSLFPVLSYNLEGGDAATLYDLARYEIKPLISRVPGVGRVDVQGSDVRESEVILDPARLAAQGMG